MKKNYSLPTLFFNLFIRRGLYVFILLGIFTHLHTIRASAAQSDFTIKDGVLIEYNGNGGKVIIPDSVKVISGSSFNNTGYSIEELVIPASVTKIEDNFLSYAPKLKNVEIKSKKLEIGDFTFYNSPWLLNNKSKYVIAGDNLIYYTGKDQVINVPKGIRRICGGSFGDSEATELNIPDGVIYIGSSAFCDFHNLEIINMPDTVEYIGPLAFGYTYSLSNITLSKNIKTIDDMAFFLSSLDKIEFPEGLKKIGQSAFDGIYLKDITFSSTISEIGYHAFASTPWLQNQQDEFIVVNKMLITYRGISTKVTIPDYINSISTGAFADSDRIEQIIVPDHVNRFSEGAFSGCKKLKKITLPSGITIIPNEMFNGCFSLTSVTLPDGIKEIGNEAFEQCIALTSIKLPNGLEKIGDSAFDLCVSLRKIVIPGSVKSMSKYMLSSCTSLSEITLLDGVKELPLIFKNETKVIVTIPDSVKKIDSFYKNYDKTTFRCKKNSYAYIFAKDYGIKLEVIK